HDDTLPVLIKAGIAHVQFETIHPFLDGNGRLGRLLITLMLCNSGMLEEPVLYMSLYLKQNRPTYYNMLQEVRHSGTWETWLEFFLNGIIMTANSAVETAHLINALFWEDSQKIAHLGRARFAAEKTFEYMKHLPQVTVPLLAQALNISAPTARKSLESMVAMKILDEVSGKKRDKVYIYRRYLSILEEGAEPLAHE
ncbi:MAG: Fic family protein, partial [Holosporales bacterium]